MSASPNGYKLKLLTARLSLGKEHSLETKDQKRRGELRDGQRPSPEEIVEHMSLSLSAAS